MSDIPDLLRRQVIAEIYQRADELSWDGLSISERSTWYNRWLDDVRIGGVLTRYMPRERARLWVKDVPMKQYNRARSGIGSYANLAHNRLPSAVDISWLALGKQWTVVEGSLQEKPNRCHLSDGRSQVLMIWGTSRNLHSLIWAGLNARVDGGPSPVLVITTRQGERLSEGERGRHQRLGELAGLEVRHVTTRATRGLSSGGGAGV